MGCPDIAILTKNLTFTTTSVDSSGSPVDADALPTYSVYEDETGTAILTGTMAKLDDTGTTGFYSEQIALTTASGFESGKTYNIKIDTDINTTSVSKTFSFILLDSAVSATLTTAGTTLSSLANVKEYMGISVETYDTLLGNLLLRATYDIQKFCQRIFISADYREFYSGDGSTDLVLNNYPVTKVQYLSANRRAAFAISNSSTDAYHAMVSVNETELRLLVQGGDNADDTSLTLASYTNMTTLQAAITALDKGWGMITNSSLAAWSPTELLPVLAGSHCLQDYADVFIPDEPITDFIVDKTSGIIRSNSRFYPGFDNIAIRYTAGYATIPADLEQICIDIVKIRFDMRDKNWLLSSEKIGDYGYVTKAGAANYAGMPSHITVRLEPWKSHRL